MHKNSKDLTGQRFGRLVALKPTEKRKGKNIVWHCICDCGNVCIVNTGTLGEGTTQSCGCLRREKSRELNTKHNMRKHPLYMVWANMIQRCENPKSSVYKWYGGRGIKVCKQWHKAIVFLGWALKNGWEFGLTIDRWPNNNGNYEPGNCRFATPLKQADNTRLLKLFIAYGPRKQIEVAKNQAVFARKWGLSAKNISGCLCGKRKQHKGWIFEYLNLRIA